MSSRRNRPNMNATAPAPAAAPPPERTQVVEEVVDEEEIAGDANKSNARVEIDVFLGNEFFLSNSWNGFSLMRRDEISNKGGFLVE